MHFSSKLAGLALTTVLVGCSSSDTTPGSADGGVTPAEGGGETDGGAPPTGEPVDAPDLEWTWVPVEGSKCRDGSQAGFGINKSAASDKLMIFLEGGGACYNASTCAANPSSYDSTKLPLVKAGVFDRTNAANPVKDWNFVYVPFCTGDVHAGNREDVEVPGVTGKQQFVGYKNLGLFMDRIVPTFPHPAQVLQTGISAGGFGAALTVEVTARKFPKGTNITLIDDSGPAMSKTYVEPCLQKGWRETWGFDDTFLKDCGADCPDKDDYAIDWTRHLTKTYADSYGGIISADNDGIITLFYGYGVNNCAADPATFPAPMTGDRFKAGLLEFRELSKGNSEKFGTYFIPSTNHTWIQSKLFYETEVGGVKLIDWFSDIVAGKAAAHVGP